MNRLSLILLIVVLGLAVGCRRINPPGGASGSRAEAARKKAESPAIAAVDGAAEAEARSNPAFAHGGSGLFSRAIAIVPQGAASQPISNASTPPERKTIIESPPPTASIVIELQPKVPPRAGPSPIIHARVSSFVPAANESEADEEAINAARDLVEKKLAELDPPVKYRPSANEVKNEFLRRDSRSVTTLKEATGPRRRGDSQGAQGATPPESGRDRPTGQRGIRCGSNGRPGAAFTHPRSSAAIRFASSAASRSSPWRVSSSFALMSGPRAT